MNQRSSIDFVGEVIRGHFDRLAPENGPNTSVWPGLTLHRATQPSAAIQVVYPASLCVVIQGRKQVVIGDDVVVYDPLHCLVVSVAVPLAAQIVEASPERPCLSMMLSFDKDTLARLILEMNEDIADTQPRAIHERAACSSQVTQSVWETIERFLRALGSEQDKRILGRGLERELIYRVLQGRHGPRLRAHAIHNSNTFRVARVIHFLEKNLERDLSIAAIAKNTGMSASTLHHSFKAVTATSPMQYLKRLRLLKARHIMLSGGLSVGEASHQVGYHSGSQFSREFKRFFGVPPSRVSDISMP